MMLTISFLCFKIFKLNSEKMEKNKISDGTESFSLDNLLIFSKISERYKILSEIGEGGMGVIYKAYDRKLKKNVAIKLIKNPIATSVKKIEKEAVKLAQIEHENVCTLYDFLVKDNISFMVMQYIEGKSLKDKIDEGSLTFKEKIDIAIQICDGLQAIHSKGIVHRDLKPSNILITSEKKVKIIDFGVSKFIKTEITDITNSLTFTETLNEGKNIKIRGTLNYMSPEVLEGKEIDERTDIFSFGVILYEMFSEEKMIKSNTLTSVVEEIMFREPDEIKISDHEVEKELNKIIKKATNKRKEKRYQNIKELKEDLIKLREKDLDDIYVEGKKRVKRKINIRKVVVIGGIIIYLLFSIFVNVWSKKSVKSLKYFSHKKMKFYPGIILREQQFVGTSPLKGELIISKKNSTNQNIIYLFKYGFYSLKKISLEDLKNQENTDVIHKIYFKSNKYKNVNISSIIIDKKGNLIVGGSYLSTSLVVRNYFGKLSPSGRIILEKSFSFKSLSSSIVKTFVDMDNNYFLVYVTIGEKLPIRTGISKVDEEGKEVWTEEVGEKGYVVSPGPSIIIRKKNLLLTTILKSTNSLKEDSFIQLTLIGEGGNILKYKKIKHENAVESFPRIVKTNNGFLFSYLSSLYSIENKRELRLIKFDNDLNIEWERAFKTRYLTNSIITIPPHEYMVIWKKKGYRLFPFFPYKYLMVTKFSEDGIPLETRRIEQNYWTVDINIYKSVVYDWYSNFILTKDVKIF